MNERMKQRKKETNLSTPQYSEMKSIAGGNGEKQIRIGIALCVFNQIERNRKKKDISTRLHSLDYTTYT